MNERPYAVRHRAIVLVQRGATYRAAAHAVGAHWYSVRRWCQDAGVESLHRGRPPKPRPGEVRWVTVPGAGVEYRAEILRVDGIRVRIRWLSDAWTHIAGRCAEVPLGCVGARR